MYSSGDSLDNTKINMINDNCGKTRPALSPLNGRRNINVPKKVFIRNIDETIIQVDVGNKPCIVTMSNRLDFKEQVVTSAITNLNFTNLNLLKNSAFVS